MQLIRFIIRPLVEAGLRGEFGLGDTTGGLLTFATERAAPDWIQ